TSNAHKRIYKLTGNSLPGGLTNNNYYYIIRDPDENSSDEIALVDAGGALGTNNLTANHMNNLVSLTSDGAGTLTESGITHFNIGTDGDFDRVSSKSNKEANWIGNVQTLTSTRDFTSDIIGSGYKVKTLQFNKLLFVVFDENDNWKAWNFGPGTTSHPTMQYRVIDLQNSLFVSSYGTLDRSKIKHWGWFYKLNGPNNRPSIDIAPVFTMKELVILGGDSTQPANMDGVFAELQENIQITSSNPSALQYLFLHSIKFGNASSGLVFSDSEKSIAFPPFADGVTQFDAYLVSLGIEYDLAASNSLNFRNSQIGSNAPFDVSIASSHSTSSTFDISGTTFVQGTGTFNSTDTIDSILFVGGN
ncbi:MAG: hypothetical protein GY928_12335, partial [Colwellia sp.]|nr:hypothetical protein [Colwellia sp.]